MALDHLVEGRRLDLQQLRGALLDPAGRFERADDQPRLHVVDDLPEGNPVARHVEVRQIERGRRLDDVGDQLGTDLALDGQHRRPLDHVLQLPHVAGPVIRLQQLQCPRRQLQVGLAVLLPVPGEEAPREQRNVLPALAQGRQLDGDDVQPIVQILPERAVRDHPLQVDVGGGDDPDVHLDGVDAPQPPELPLLDHPQQLGLGFQRDRADFVEEDASLIGHLEEALLGGHRAGEGPLHVTEEVRLQQIRRQAARVDGDERPAGARRVGVYRARHELLAGSALPRDQNRGAAGRRLRDGLEHRPDARAVADDVGEPARLRPQAPAQRAVLAREPLLRHRVAHDEQHVVVLERLFDEVEGAALERLAGVPGSAERRDHDHRGRFVEPRNLVESRQPVHPGHHHVEQHRVERLRPRALDAFAAGGRKPHAAPLALQQGLEDLPHDRLVVDDQQRSPVQHRFRHAVSGPPRWPAPGPAPPAAGSA